MKITRVGVEVTSEAKRHPVRDAIQTLDRNGVVRVRVEVEGGGWGESTTYFGREESSPRLLGQLITELLAPAVIGREHVMIREIRDVLVRLTDYQGTSGLSRFGISAIDLALWDLLGRALDQPVWSLLGGQRTLIPTYAMVGWLELGVAELEQVCAKAIEQGFRGVKVKVGANGLGVELDRLRAVRNAIGPEAELMVDANQAFDVPEALRRGRKYEELGCRWFEEPIRADDTAGHERLSTKLDIPIAAGENRYGQRDFLDLFTRRAVSIVQPDLRRAGGLTDCFEVGLTAAAFGIGYASHGGGPHIHVLAALPNTLFLESGLLGPDSTVELVDGCYPVPTAPGLSAHDD